MSEWLFLKNKGNRKQQLTKLAERRENKKESSGRVQFISPDSLNQIRFEFGLF
jgi:hypothetical protein